MNYVKPTNALEKVEETTLKKAKVLLRCFLISDREMLRIRVKMGPARSKEWTCCFGLHVRTVTITIGLWHLVSFFFF